MKGGRDVCFEEEEKEKTDEGSGVNYKGGAERDLSRSQTSSTLFISGPLKHLSAFVRTYISSPP